MPTDLDEDSLRSSLSAQLDETITDTAVLHDGLNLSIAISTVDTERAYVLRTPRKLRETAFFNDLEQEYRLHEHLAETTVDVPEPVVYCDETSALGEPFFVMAYVHGEELPVGSQLPERFQTPSARETLSSAFVDTLADIHTLDTRRFDDCCSDEDHYDQIAAAIDRLDNAARVTGTERPVLREVAAWLLDNIPESSDTALLHGDYKLGNVFLSTTEKPAIVSVTDWETAYLGDPLTELAYALTYWRDSDDSVPDISDLTGDYSEETLQDVRQVSERGLYPFTTAPGSPSRAELVARYENRTGNDFENERFYRAREAFMLATVWADLHRSDVADGGGEGGAPLVEYMARVARRLIEGTL